MTVIKNDSEQILKSLDANLPFVSELLQADIKLFIKNHNDDIVVHNYFHPNQDLCLLVCKKNTVKMHWIFKHLM